MFLTKVGVYFKTKSPSLGCNLYICEMTNYHPDFEKNYKSLKWSPLNEPALCDDDEILDFLDYWKVSTKLITVMYQNEKIEVYD